MAEVEGGCAAQGNGGGGCEPALSRYRLGICPFSGVKGLYPSGDRTRSAKARASQWGRVGPYRELVPHPAVSGRGQQHRAAVGDGPQAGTPIDPQTIGVAVSQARRRCAARSAPGARSPRAGARRGEPAGGRRRGHHVGFSLAWPRRRQPEGHRRRKGLRIR